MIFKKKAKQADKPQELSGHVRFINPKTNQVELGKIFGSSFRSEGFTIVGTIVSTKTYYHVQQGKDIHDIQAHAIELV